MRVLLCTIAYCKKLLEHSLNVSADLRFDGIEVWGREPHVPEKFDENRMRATMKLIESAKVTPYVFGSYLRFGSTKNDLDIALSDVLHIARWLKTPLVRVWASDVPSADADDDVWDRTVTEAREACVRAEKLGMTFAVEMHGGTLADTGKSAKRLMEEVDRSNFRLNYQIASHRDGQTPEQRLETVLPWVVHMHAQNYSETPDTEGEPVKRVPLAMGEASYPSIIGILKDNGYAGDISIEFAYDETGDKTKSIADDLEFLRALC